jgi:hypothetical protein
MPVVLSGTNGVTFPDSSLQAAAASPYVLKNRIINGDMRIDQRNAGASVTPANADYTLDRYQSLATQTSKYSIQRNAGAVTPPVGFSYYLGVTSLSAYSVTSSDNFGIQQLIEGFNFADFAWGTANAQTATLSFWVRSSLTGTFGGALANESNTRSYPFTYTISAANTWEQKSVTIPGDTTGTWVGATVNVGVKVIFGLGTGATLSGTAGAWAGSNFRSATGATSVVGTSGATFYITGVQLEQNTTATPFERRLYGQELANCQRYFLQTGGASAYQAIFGAFGTTLSTTLATLYFPLPVSMRTSPTLAYTGTPRLDNGQAGFNISAMNGAIIATNLSTGVLNITSTGLTLYQPVKIDTNAGGSIVTLSAEL